MTMIKKVAVYAVVGLVGAGILSKTRVGSHIASAWHSGVRAVEEAVPPEQELERIRYEIGRLDKEIDRAKGQLADARVAALTAAEDAESRKIDLAERDERIRARAAAIKSGEIKVRHLGRPATPDEATQLLAADVDAFKVKKKELAVVEKQLAVAARNEKTAEKHLAAVAKQKTELALAVQSLEADLRLLRLEQTENKYSTDDGRLGDIKQSVKDVKRRIDVMRKRESLNGPAEDEVAEEARDIDALLQEHDAQSKKGDPVKID